MRHLMRTSLLLASAFLLAGGTARAATVVEASVPFAFSVRGQTLPPGKYRVERSYDSTILMIEGEHGVHATVVAATTEASGSDPAGNKAALVFTHSEAGYRLKDVWADHSTGREILGR